MGSITDELRTLAKTPGDLDTFEILAAADRIDEAHEAEVARWIEQAHFDKLADMGDDVLAEAGLVRLPVDADGRPWRVGDMEALGGKISALRLAGYFEPPEPHWELVYEDGGKCVTPETCRHVQTTAGRLREIAERLDSGERQFGLSDALREVADELEGRGRVSAPARAPCPRG